jgi:hypothetical protein
LLFLAFSSLSGWGLSRNTLATEPRTTQVEHAFPNADQHQYISDKNAYLASKGSWGYNIAKFFGLTPHETRVPE